MNDATDLSDAMPFRTAGEWAAHLRWRSLVLEEQGLRGWAQEALGRPIDELEDKLFRTDGVTLADRAVVRGIDLLSRVARASARKRWAMSVYRRQGERVERFDEIQDLPLNAVDRAVKVMEPNYMTAAGTGGAVAGALGAVGVFGSIPPLLLVSLNATHRLGLLHGHDPQDPDEQRFAVLVLATGLVSRPSLRSQVVNRLQAVAQELESPGPPEQDPPAQDYITQNVAEALALQIILGLLTRSWPLAGMVLGASYSRAFVQRAFNTALAAYGQRALLRRYGDAARIDTRR
ncbi:MAG: EcsC family protein [Myxococcales bacterium]|jgi:hypothetical protein